MWFKKCPFCIAGWITKGKEVKQNMKYRFTKQILSVVASGAVLLGTAMTPVFADTNLSAVGNGADSQNVISSTSTNTTTVSQNNTANVSNTVNSSSNTGDNTASKNTGGDTAVLTGDASTRTSIDNMLNSNSATTACCNAGDTNVSLRGNGADSVSSVQADLNNAKTIVQGNTANVANNVSSDANSGYNRANENTGGNTTVMTGNAGTRTGVTTNANSNVANLGGGSSSGGSTNVELLGNGADSVNGASLRLDNSSRIGQTNTANVSNNVNSSADTGYNRANENTGGSVRVDTGSASTLTGVETKANFNWADINCCGTFDVSALVARNGADSRNTMYLAGNTTKDAVQTNTANVGNYVDSSADTGYNSANENTGNTVRLFTGDANTATGVDNMLNFNHASLDCCLTGFNAEAFGNGADSINGISNRSANTAADYQTNTANLANNLGGLDAAMSGYNKASENTGNNSLTFSGNSQSMNRVSNSANMNDAGSNAVSMPGFGVSFNWSTDWMNSLMSMFH